MIHSSDVISACGLFEYNGRRDVTDILISRSFHRHTLFSLSYIDSSTVAEKEDGIICIPTIYGV